MTPFALAALSELAVEDCFPKSQLAAAIKTLEIDSEKPNPATS